MGKSPFITLGALFAFLAVMLGAFGAHALRDTLSEHYLSVYQTATDYQMWHAIGLIIIGILYERKPSKSLLTSGWLMLAGIVIFPGSLFVFSLTGIKILGAITPLGGILFLIAWLLLAYTSTQSK
jgi:uncharacterized membrane protein YgdD (TMEM256/DUF423 family)